jgi:hypothetical protein
MHSVTAQKGRSSLSLASAGIAFVIFAAAIGGWEWAVVTVCGTGASILADRRWQTVAAAGAAGLIWLALFQVTGNRQLFFPFAMQWAVQATLPVRGRVRLPAFVGGGILVGLFTAIRVWQDASVRVLAVELVVAAAVLGVVGLAFGAHRAATKTRLAAGTLGSVLAFAGLIF